MPKRIESITLEKFKGATNNVTIDFDTSKPVVIIFGENGSGKSTIIDAIDFVFNDSFGSIDQRSTTGSKADLLASLGSPSDNLKVVAKYAGNDWTGIIGHGKKPVSTGSGDRATVKILRRSEILKIVDGQPTARYDALKSFINVPKAENNENALRTAVNDSDKKYNDAVNAYLQAEQSLKEAWEAEGKPEVDYKIWAKNKSGIDATTLALSSSKLNSIILKINDCITACESLSISEINYELSEKAYIDAEQKYNSVRESIKGMEKDIVDVLEKAKDFLAKYPTVESCPVCEKSENAKELTDKIDKRLLSLKSLIEAKKVYEAARKNLDVQNKVLLSKKSDWVGKVRDLASFVRDSSTPEIDSLKITWPDFAAVLSFNKSDEADIAAPIAKQLWESLLQSKGAIESRKQKEEKEANQLKLIKTAYQTYTNKTIQSKRLEKELDTLKKLHVIVEKERKDFVESELGSISDVVDSLYTSIHPAEGLGKVKFYLNPKFIGSLGFTGEFQGTDDVQPQAYYSESHLDTLGVCIFLALAKKYSDENTIVILDDVITSIDQAHMTRFINMLHGEADNINQLIITTHYRPWKDRYKYYGGPTANVQLIELLHWSHPRGIRHTKAKLSVEELEEYLQEAKYDRQTVANKAGVLLEGLIDHIALRYNCRIPRKAEPDYTLGELLSSIESKLRKALTVQKKQTDGSVTLSPLEPILEEIKTLSWIRNEVGCHFRLDNNTSDTEVKHFGEITIELAKALICHGCGELPYRDKSGSYWECRCGSAQMHPHKIPS